MTTDRTRCAVRPMEATDAAAVAALIRTAFAAIPVPLDPAPSALRVTEADVQAVLGSGGGAVADDMQGCVLWVPKERGLYLSRLAVAPDAWGSGIARALLAEVEAEARRRGLPRVLLEVRLALTGNRRLFAACGFVETALRSHPGFTAPTFAEAEKPV